MIYDGFFINLDRSTGRRAEMESHLAGLGLDKVYRRFPAAEGNSLDLPHPAPHLLPGEIGCFLSHYLLLKHNLGRTTPLHVIEDDVIFSRHAAPVIEWLIHDNQMAYYDIIYLDTFIPTANFLYKRYRKLYNENVQRHPGGQLKAARFSVIDMKDVDFATTGSMLFSPQGVKKLHDLYAAEIAAGPTMQVDLFICQKARQGLLKVGCIFPFVTSIRLEHVMSTTLGEDKLRLSALATSIARQSFFLECDWEKCRAYIAEYLAMPAGDPQLQVLSDILAFSLDERFSFA